MFFNSTPQHGNLDNPNHNAYAHNWRNKDAAQEPYTVDWTQVPDRYKNTWPNGAYPQYMAETPYYPNYVAGQPRYPNEPYREGTSGTLGGKLNVNANYTHEHIYLDRDDFTAIRQHKSVRPLKNPGRMAGNGRWNNTGHTRSANKTVQISREIRSTFGILPLYPRMPMMQARIAVMLARPRQPRTDKPATGNWSLSTGKTPITR